MMQNSTPSTGETPTPSTAEASYPLISVATVPTERAARYGKQLVSHMGHKITGSWDEEAGSGYLLFDREGPILGRFDVIASASDLRLELRTEPERADRLEFIVGIHLARFGARDSLAISWERTDGSEGSTQGPLTPEEVEAHARAKKAAREAAAREAAQEAGHAEQPQRTRRTRRGGAPKHGTHSTIGKTLRTTSGHATSGHARHPGPINSACNSLTTERVSVSKTAEFQRSDFKS